MLANALLTLSVALLFLGSFKSLKVIQIFGRRRGGLCLGIGMAGAGLFFLPDVWRVWQPGEEPIALGRAAIGLFMSLCLYRGVSHLARQFHAGPDSAEALRSVEDALEESESRYRSMLAAMTEGAILRDGEGRVLAVNAAAERLLGRRGEELKRLAEDPSEERLLAADGSEMDPRDLPSLVTLRTGKPIRDFTIGVGRPDGQFVWLKINSTPLIRRGAARPHGAMATMTDVTEARHIEEELRRSHERTAAILESITDGFLSVDRQWQLEFVNSSAADMLGVHAEDLHGKDLWEALPDIRGSSLGAHFRAAMDNDEVVHFEEYFESGAEWFAGTVYPFEGGISLYFRSVTDEQKARQALSDSEDRFRTLAENVPVVVFLCDPSPGYRILFLSEAVFKLTGRPRQDFLAGDISFEELYHEDDLPSVLAEVDAALAERRSYSLTVRIRHMDGTWRWVEEIGVGVFREDQLLYLEGYFVDVTERRRVHERQSLMMAELDHRVKNNISTIMALSQQTLARSMNLTEFSDSFMGRIGAMARTHEALAATRWDGVVLRDVLRLTLGPYVGLVDGRIESEGEDFSLPAAAAAPIGLALHELTTNAVKYGALSRESGRLHIQWRREGDDVLVTWTERDTGANGRPVPQPASHERPCAGGLGMTLLRGLIEYELGGTVRHELTPEGLTCELRIGLVDLRDDGGRLP